MVYKIPLKMRPLIYSTGTFVNYWSRWLDYWLQKVKPSIPSYLKNGDQLLEEVLPLDIPSWAYLMVTDATAVCVYLVLNNVLNLKLYWVILRHHFFIDDILLF